MLRLVIDVETKQKIPSITYIFETNDEQKMLINVLEQIDCQNLIFKKCRYLYLSIAFDIMTCLVQKKKDIQ